jgi:hypothetical protein
MRWSSMSSTRGGGGGSPSGLMSCASVMRKLPSVMQGVDEPASLGQNKRRVRWLRSR